MSLVSQAIATVRGCVTVAMDQLDRDGIRRLLPVTTNSYGLTQGSVVTVYLLNDC